MARKCATVCHSVSLGDGGGEEAGGVGEGRRDHKCVAQGMHNPESDREVFFKHNKSFILHLGDYEKHNLFSI